MKTVAFFNNKGGVGKTSLAYHLAWMFADLRTNVVAIDLDPQSNLTSSFLRMTSSRNYGTLRNRRGPFFGSVQPLLDRLGDIAEPVLIDVDDRIRLVPGDLGLSLLKIVWPKPGASALMTIKPMRLMLSGSPRPSIGSWSGPPGRMTLMSC